MLLHSYGWYPYINSDFKWMKSKTASNLCPGYDTKLHLMLRVQFWRSGEYLFIAITSRSILTRSSSIYQRPYLFRNYSNSTGPYTHTHTHTHTHKKILKKPLCKYENVNAISLTSGDKITVEVLTYRFNQLFLVSLKVIMKVLGALQLF